jgi:hypothetical protein
MQEKSAMPYLGGVEFSRLESMEPIWGVDLAGEEVPA